MSYLINVTNKVSPPHQHKNYEIIIYTEGSSVFVTPEKNYSVSAGNIIIVPPYTEHNSSPDTNPERIYINGEFNHIFNLSSPIVISDNTEKTGTTLAKMIYNNRYGNPDFIESLCNAFAHFLLQNLKMEDNIGLTVKEIISEIIENFYDSNIDLCRILNKTGYAEDYIRSQFKKVTGKTPNAFLTNIRIRHACYLIDIYRNSLSLGQIAEKCGYTDYIYFSRRFKKVMGISPQKYKDFN